VCQAVILVERETQAPIVLGRGGSAIKKLGSASRQQIEEFLGRQVYLELTVQVRLRGWPLAVIYILDSPAASWVHAHSCTGLVDTVGFHVC
jgi:hypothetical protein